MLIKKRLLIYQDEEVKTITCDFDDARNEGEFIAGFKKALGSALLQYATLEPGTENTWRVLYQHPNAEITHG